MPLTCPNELGTAPIGKLLRDYAMPAITAMCAASLYNIVDSIFIGQGCGAAAFSGFSVTFPLMNILAAFGSLVGVGASSLISIKLGQREYDTANLILGNVVLLNILISGIIAVFGLLFIDPILYLFGASELTLPYARSYMVIILACNFYTHIYFGLNGVLRASGNPQQAMYATFVAVGINTILDPIFIFLFDMGVQGAAFATVLAQGIAVIWQIILLRKENGILRFSRKIWHFNKKIDMEIISIGLSPFLMNLASCAVVGAINRSLLHYGGDLAIGAYGVINKYTHIFCLIIMGLTQGMQPIVGYNYGARQYERMTRAYWLTTYWALGITTIVFLLAEFLPDAMAKIFSKDPELIRVAAHGLRISCSAFLLTGFPMVVGSFFTSIGMARKAIFLSLTRQVIYLIPCILILPKFFGIEGVWFSMPISDLLAVATAGIMQWRLLRHFKTATLNGLK